MPKMHTNVTKHSLADKQKKQDRTGWKDLSMNNSARRMKTGIGKVPTRGPAPR
jgi:hypothetical protein